MPASHRLLAPVLSVCLAVPAAALPASTAAAPPASSEGDLDEVKDLYAKGKAKFGLAKYEEALEYWEKAYEILPDGGDSRGIRNALVYNISEAQVRAYEIDRNPTRLRRAKLLLEQYLAEHRKLYGDEDQAVKERADARARLDDVEAKIAESDEAGETAAPVEGASETPAGPAAPAGGPKYYSDKELNTIAKNDPEFAKDWKKGTDMMIAGAILLPVGVVLAAPDGAGTCAFGCVALGGSAAITGIVLLAIGVPKRKKIRAAVREKVGISSPAPTAWLNRRSGGAAIGWRF